jgi:adenosylcobinamide-GDP ribazoletransferase
LRLLAALQFLTTLPIRHGFSTEEIGRSTSYFPVVGLIIGAILAGLNYAFGLILPASVVNVLLIAALVLLSGGLHLDGLLDTCDGIAGHRTVEERWQIMHDSRAGGMGVIGVAVLLLVKFVSLDSIPHNLMFYTLMLMPVISRWAMVYAIYAFPYARPSGLGKMFKDMVTRRQMVVATLITLVLAGVLFMLAGLIIIVFVLTLVTLVAWYLKRKLAGLTGDTYGAINEMAETGVLIMVCLLAHQGWLLPAW